MIYILLAWILVSSPFEEEPSSLAGQFLNK